MPLKAIVKVSHISNLSDARYCAGMGVEMLGFRVVPGGGQYMPPEIFQDIRGWIAGPKIVAELYGVSSLQQLQYALGTYSPDYVELGWDEYKAFGQGLSLPCIVYAKTGTEAQSLQKTESMGYLLLDEHVSCRDISSIRIPTLLKIGTLQILQEKQREGCFKGYALEGPDEIRPGITNYDRLGAILEALEEEN